jgi:calcium-dependent protein kinase
MKGDQGERMK